jgi:hypothetical protein
VGAGVSFPRKLGGNDGDSSGARALDLAVWEDSDLQARSGNGRSEVWANRAALIPVTHFS